jgi:hypothetical protein
VCTLPCEYFGIATRIAPSTVDETEPLSTRLDPAMPVSESSWEFAGLSFPAHAKGSNRSAALLVGWRNERDLDKQRDL